MLAFKTQSVYPFLSPRENKCSRILNERMDPRTTHAYDQLRIYFFFFCFLFYDMRSVTGNDDQGNGENACCIISYHTNVNRPTIGSGDCLFRSVYYRPLMYTLYFYTYRNLQMGQTNLVASLSQSHQRMRARSTGDG